MFFNFIAVYSTTTHPNAVTAIPRTSNIYIYIYILYLKFYPMVKGLTQIHNEPNGTKPSQKIHHRLEAEARSMWHWTHRRIVSDA